jgi:hypothetical protein
VTDPKNIVDDLDRPIWGAEAIGRVIGKNEGQTFYLLGQGLLDANRIGGQWCSTPRRLLNSIAEGK